MSDPYQDFRQTSSSHYDATDLCISEGSKISIAAAKLTERGIQVQITRRNCIPPEAAMHDRGAVTPTLVISPMSEWGVVESLRIFKELKLYGETPISVKSGGHGYFNGATCSGIMLNLGKMIKQEVVESVLVLQPGCMLGQVIHTLAENKKAVPHGDCFGVGAGGHFLTAGWDLILARRYGLGCQSVVGGRIVLWDGSVIEVDEQSQPTLLYAMRGGAAAGVGVVTQIRLRLMEEPQLATWRFKRISESELSICVAQKAFANSVKLPRDISVSFRFHFEQDQEQPVCSFNVVSLLPARDTIRFIHQCLGSEVGRLLDNKDEWSEKDLLSLRMLPASEFMAAHPGMLAEVFSEALHCNPRTYWKESVTSREMGSSFADSRSYWVVPSCDDMLKKLYEQFQTATGHRSRNRLYALVIQGGGHMLDLKNRCSMPLGEALARFEVHWDDPKREEEWCRQFTDRVSDIIQASKDTGPQRPYRGDIWMKEQEEDDRLRTIRETYDRRFDRCNMPKEQ